MPRRGWATPIELILAQRYLQRQDLSQHPIWRHRYLPFSSRRKYLFPRRRSHLQHLWLLLQTPLCPHPVDQSCWVQVMCRPDAEGILGIEIERRSGSGRVVEIGVQWGTDAPKGKDARSERAQRECRLRVCRSDGQSDGCFATNRTSEKKRHQRIAHAVKRTYLCDPST